MEASAHTGIVAEGGGRLSTGPKGASAIRRLRSYISAAVARIATVAAGRAACGKAEYIGRVLVAFGSPGVLELAHSRIA